MTTYRYQLAYETWEGGYASAADAIDAFERATGITYIWGMMVWADGAWRHIE